MSEPEPTSSPGMPDCPKGSGEHGIGWIELLAPETEASARFYEAVFGWEVTAFAPGYQTFTAPNGGPFGGFRGNAPAGSPPCTPYIHVPDVAAAQAQVVAAGGVKLTEPESIGSGMIGHFSAPGGTIYGLVDIKATQPWQPAPFGNNPKPAVNTLCSLEMYGGPDLEATARFFSKLFGWGTLATMPGYLMFDAGVSLGGVFQGHTPSVTGTAYIYVSDVSATLKAIVEAGGASLGDPMVLPGMATMGYFKDPCGTMMGLMGP